MSSVLPQPAPGFDQPIDALIACHERMTKQLGILTRLPQHLAQHGADAEAQRAAAAVLRYFDRSAPHHHQDEEVDLFPRMAVHAVEDDVRNVSILTAALREEHVAMAEAWERLRPAVEAVSLGKSEALDAENFVARYRDHIAREEAELFPLARKLLSAEDYRAIGEAMAARRGLPPPGS